MEQLFDCSSINSSCSSSSNAHTPTRDTLKANETQVKSANSVTFKTKTNNNKSTIISNTPSATVTKQLNRTNTVSAASIRSIKKTNSAKSTTSAASNTSSSGNKRKQAQISSAKSIAITSDTFDLDCFLQNIINNKYKRILVLTGAGISTASGIPDFRTPGTGIYDNLSKYCVPYPEAIFERAYFHRNPRPFFKIAKEIMPNFDKYRPNKIHFFLRLLQEKKLLLRLYTQNIDNLETVAGIKSEKLIEAHGSFRSATCIKCQEEYPGSFVENAVQNDKVPLCKDCNGVVKPDIVFFGEDLPTEFFQTYKRDFSIADLVIIIGTSLEVEPFASIINECPINVPRILMNKNLVGPFRLKSSYRKRDLTILGDLTNTVETIASKIGWENELNQLCIRELEIINNNQKLLKIKKLEELKKQEELQKVLEVAAAKLSETKQTQTTEQQLQHQQKLAQSQQPAININNKNVLTENQIKAKSILLSKHNLLKTTNEDKFLTNILEKYSSIKNKFDSEAKVTKTSMESSSSSYTTETLVRSNSFKRSLDPTFNRNKILDIYLIKSQLRIGDSFKFAEKIFNNEQQITSSNPRNKSSSENIFPIPMTTSNLVENLNTNRNLYIANSKPLLIKRNLEMTTNMTMTSGDGNTMPLSFSKINMEKIKMIEKKNNELLIKDGENFKLC